MDSSVGPGGRSREVGPEVQAHTGPFLGPFWRFKITGSLLMFEILPVESGRKEDKTGFAVLFLIREIFLF